MKTCNYVECTERATNKYPMIRTHDADLCRKHYDEIYDTHHHPYNPHVIPKLKKEHQPEAIK